MIRAIAAIVIVLFAGLAFAACGDDGDSNTTPTATTVQSEGDPTVTNGEGPPPVSAEPTVTDSGLQIIDIEVGTGAEAALASTITIDYTGWLADGTVFDSTVDSGQPLTYPVNQFIDGWKEGIPGMKEGGKRRLIIPSDLAYGPGGYGNIPPDAELTFDVELLAVESP